ncbi:MAG: choice-of-anchor tandem repeat GloVer-containing protein [Thermoanaerobaculaceae bacterium]
MRASTPQCPWCRGAVAAGAWLTALLALALPASAVELPKATPLSPAAYLVTVTNPGPGAGTIASTPAGLSCDTSCWGWFPAGSALTLDATAGAGSEFVRWFGDCEGAAPCALTIDGPKLAVGSFKPAGDPYTVLRNLMPAGHDGHFPYYGRLVSDGVYLYGATAWGGRANGGLVYRLGLDGSGFHVLHEFVGKPNDGRLVFGGLSLSNGVLYGTTRQGGSQDAGSVFRIGTDGTGFSVLYSLSPTQSGRQPQGSVAPDGSTLWGVTPYGGSGWGGTLFKLSVDGTGFEVVKAFGNQPLHGKTPLAAPVISAGEVFGTLSEGGQDNQGAVFRYRVSDASFTLLHSFSRYSAGGLHPHGDLLLDGAVLFGMTSTSPNMGYGAVFRMNTDGTNFLELHSFAGGPNDGAVGEGSFVLADGFLYGLTRAGGLNDKGTVFRIATDGTGFQLLHSFGGSPADGAVPYGSMVRVGNTLFGATSGGGLQDGGVVFRIDLDGTGYQILRSFAPYLPDPVAPLGGMVGEGGVLYGAGAWGGPDGLGCVYRVQENGADFQVLHSFLGVPEDGANPGGPLILDDDALYGVTEKGGTNGFGTVFKVGTDGSGLSLLRQFAGPPDDGARPVGALLLDGATLYGATAEGGAHGVGTIFKVGTNGSGYQVLVHLSDADGANPVGSLVLRDGFLFGASTSGGDKGSIFRVRTDGTELKMLQELHDTWQSSAAPNGPLTLVGDSLFGTTMYYGGWGYGGVFTLKIDGSGFTYLRSFRSGSDSVGCLPWGGLTLEGGVLFGTTSLCGGPGGTVFRINLDGSGFQPLHALQASQSEGSQPRGGLMVSGDRVFGATRFGGVSEYGVLFALRKEVTISGEVTMGGNGLAGVHLLGLPGDPTTDGSGQYSVSVPLRWSGTVTPTLGGHSFDPASRVYADVQVDHTMQDYQATSCPTIALTPEELPAGFLQDLYEVQLIANGGMAPYVFSVASGSLPTGLSLTTDTGLISGTPTAPGQVTFSVAVRDAAGCGTFRTYSLAVASHFSAVALDVDRDQSGSTESDLNGVLEPGESVTVSPSWRNGDDAARVLTSTAKMFTGPAEATYSLADWSARYGTVPAGATISAHGATGDAFRVRLSGGSARPAPHWDARFTETLNDGTVKVWTLHIGDSFADVPRSHWAYVGIEALLHAGLTTGCLQQPLRYCPESLLTRAEMAVFLERGLHGASYVPPAATGTVFADVPASHWAAAWIERLYADGVTTGCGQSPLRYCPEQVLARSEMAVFLLRLKHGASYVPPAGTGTAFSDVPSSHWAVGWIEQLAAEGITTGCGGGKYCPEEAVPRSQMAVFLQRTLGLRLAD